MRPTAGLAVLVATLTAGRARGLSLAARSLPRGRYRIRLTIRRAGVPARSVTLVTRRL